MGKRKFPERPTQLQQLGAIICDELRIPRLKDAKTIEDWELEVIIYWMERMVHYMEKKDEAS